MIILEGPDLSGKSTIGKRIEYLTPRTVYQSGALPKTQEEAYDKLLNTVASFVYDRHLAIAEQIYGGLGAREQLIITPILDLWLALKAPLILYCDPGLEYLTRQLENLTPKPSRSKHQVYQIRTNYPKIYYKYRSVMKKLKLFTRVEPVNFKILTDKEIKKLCKD